MYFDMNSSFYPVLLKAIEKIRFNKFYCFSLAFKRMFDSTSKY